MPRPSCARYSSTPRPSASIWRSACSSCGPQSQRCEPNTSPGHALGVHADEDVLDTVDLALDEREVVLVVDLRAEADRAELAVLGRQQHLGLTLDELLGAAPMRDQVLDRAELEAVLLAELDEVRHAGHRAVVLHDLADHAGGREPGQPREIDGALGLPRALERPAGAGAQREDVSGLHDVARAHAGIDRDLDRARAVAGRDAGLDALARLDRDGEGRLVGGLVVRDHEPQAELVAALGRQREADQAAAVASP